MRASRWWIGGLAWVGLLTSFVGFAPACPLCSSVQMTLSEEIARSDVAVIATLAERAAAPTDAAVPDAPGTQPEPQNAFRPPLNTIFEINHVIRGEKLLADQKRLATLYYGEHPEGTKFLIFGVNQNPPDQLDEPNPDEVLPDVEIAWSTPTPLSSRSTDYVMKLAALPESGAERLEFFLDYFEDADLLVANDSYEEFAKAPYADVRVVAARTDREHLLAWIKNTDVPTIHRRLYLLMLGVCGLPEDIPLLEQMLKSEDRQSRSALDALIACYLNLKGADGMPLIEDLFLKNDKAEYTDTYSAIMALRVLGQEGGTVPKERLVEGLRYLLDRPQLADLVIPDLARWQDWSVMDRLVKLFKEADDESAWVRVPVVNYLRACPLPVARQYIDELAKIDPEAVKRSNQFFSLAAPKPPQPPIDPAIASDSSATSQSSEPVAADTSGSQEGTPAADSSADTNVAGASAEGDADVVDPLVGDKQGTASNETDSSPVNKPAQASGTDNESAGGASTEEEAPASSVADNSSPAGTTSPASDQKLTNESSPSAAADVPPSGTSATENGSRKVALDPVEGNGQAANSVTAPGDQEQASSVPSQATTSKKASGLLLALGFVGGMGALLLLMLLLFGSLRSRV